MQDLTIFVSSCDKYSDLWSPFFYCFSKFYKYDNEPIIVTSEGIDFSYPGLNVIVQPGDDKKNLTWGELTCKYLDLVQTKYILFMLDDFFIRKPIKMDIIKKNLEDLEYNHNILYFSYSYVEDGKNLQSKYGDFLERPQKGRYKLNTQPCLWRTDDLKKLVHDWDNPWDWEDYGTRRLWYTSKKCYCLNSYDGVIDYGYRKDGMWAVRRGKWVIDEIKPFFDSINLTIDYSKRGEYHHVDYRKDSIILKIKRLPQTMKQIWSNHQKKIKNNQLGKFYAKENG